MQLTTVGVLKDAPNIDQWIVDVEQLQPCKVSEISGRSSKPKSCFIPYFGTPVRFKAFGTVQQGVGEGRLLEVANLNCEGR